MKKNKTTAKSFHTSSGSFATISTSDISNPTDPGSMIHAINKLHNSSLQNVPGITWGKPTTTVMSKQLKSVNTNCQYRVKKTRKEALTTANRVSLHCCGINHLTNTDQCNTD